MESLNAPGVRYRPCVVVAHLDASFAAEVCKRFRRLGWDVYRAAAGPELRRLARMLAPELVLLDVNLDGESGWLTCAKLKQERPAGRIVLVADGCSPHVRELAEFVGASAVVPRASGPAALVQQGWSRPDAAAG